MQIDRYIPPPDHPLHPYIESIWRVESYPSHATETILPKQNVDILFNLAQAYAIVDGTEQSVEEIRGFHVVGAQTNSFVVHPQGHTKMLGISLKMDGCSALLSLPLNELTDQVVEGTDIFPQQRFLWEQVAETDHFVAQRDLLLQWLATHLQPHPHLCMIQRACWLLREQPTSHAFDQIANELAISTRHLRRMMLRHTGVGPAQYMRISRFVKSLYLMPNAYSLTDIAHRVHYSDQAHFCRDFKEIAGMTPQAYRKRMSRVPGHIFER